MARSNEDCGGMKYKIIDKNGRTLSQYDDLLDAMDVLRGMPTLCRVLSFEGKVLATRVPAKFSYDKLRRLPISA